MQRLRAIARHVGLCAIASIISAPAQALRIEPGVGAGLSYTDNAKLDKNDKEDDWILGGYVGAKIEQDSGPLQLDATTALNYQHYFNSSYSDKYYFDLSGVGEWEQVRNRLSWRMTDRFSQRQINADANDNEKNVQNTNVFTFGPTVTQKVADRQTVTINPLFTDYYYETTSINSRRYALNAGWFYQMRPTFGTSLTGSTTLVKYEKSDRNPDVTFNSLYAGINGVRPRLDYTVNAGITYVKRDSFDDQTGFSGNLALAYSLNSRSSLRVTANTELTDTSQQLRRVADNPDDSDFRNDQPSSDVIRNKVARVSYNRNDPAMSSTLWGYVSSTDYKETPFDRESQAFGLQLNRPVTPLITAGAYGEFRRTKRTDEDQTDKRYTVGANLAYQLSRKLVASFDLRYRERDSTESGSDYKEMSGFASVTWGFGSVRRPSSGSGGY